MTSRAVSPGPRLLFRVAAGPRLGFGHLVRSARLAAALGVPWLVSLRGAATARSVAKARGARLQSVTPHTLRSRRWDAVVVDDPSSRHGAPWVHAARARGVLVVTIHDLGLGATGADLAIDGSLEAPDRACPAERCRAGPRFAILAPPPDQRLRTGTRGKRRGVLVSLGGGPRSRTALQLVEALRHASATLDISLAPGLTAPSPAMVRRCGRLGVTVVAPDRFGASLRTATVAILAGGTSLYEAAAARTPAVAVAIVDAQRQTLRAFARAGLAHDAGILRAGSSPPTFARVAASALALLADGDGRRRMAGRGARAIDGRGATRVAAILAEAIAARRAAGLNSA